MGFYAAMQKSLFPTPSSVYNKRLISNVSILYCEKGVN